MEEAEPAQVEQGASASQQRTPGETLPPQLAPTAQAPAQHETTAGHEPEQPSSPGSGYEETSAADDAADDDEAQVDQDGAAHDGIAQLQPHVLRPHAQLQQPRDSSPAQPDRTRHLEQLYPNAPKAVSPALAALAAAGFTATPHSVRQQKQHRGLAAAAARLGVPDVDPAFLAASGGDPALLISLVGIAGKDNAPERDTVLQRLGYPASLPPGARGHGKSPFRGVFWDKKNLRWRAQVGYQNRKIFMGYFDAAEEAARAYDRKVVQLHGPLGKTNFPMSEYGPELQAYTQAHAGGRGSGALTLPQAAALAMPVGPWTEPAAAAGGSAHDAAARKRPRLAGEGSSLTAATTGPHPGSSEASGSQDSQRELLAAEGGGAWQVDEGSGRPRRQSSSSAAAGAAAATAVATAAAAAAGVCGSSSDLVAVAGGTRRSSRKARLSGGVSDGGGGGSVGGGQQRRSARQAKRRAAGGTAAHGFGSEQGNLHGAFAAAQQHYQQQQQWQQQWQQQQQQQQQQSASEADLQRLFAMQLMFQQQALAGGGSGSYAAAAAAAAAATAAAAVPDSTQHGYGGQAWPGLQCAPKVAWQERPLAVQPSEQALAAAMAAASAVAAQLSGSLGGATGPAAAATWQMREPEPELEALPERGSNGLQALLAAAEAAEEQGLPTADTTVMCMDADRPRAEPAPAATAAAAAAAAVTAAGAASAAATAATPPDPVSALAAAALEATAGGSGGGTAAAPDVVDLLQALLGSSSGSAAAVHAPAPGQQHLETSEPWLGAGTGPPPMPAPPQAPQQVAAVPGPSQAAAVAQLQSLVLELQASVAADVGVAPVIQLAQQAGLDLEAQQLVLLLLYRQLRQLKVEQQRVAQSRQRLESQLSLLGALVSQQQPQQPPGPQQQQLAAGALQQLRQAKPALGASLVAALLAAAGAGDTSPQADTRDLAAALGLDGQVSPADLEAAAGLDAAALGKLLGGLVGDFGQAAGAAATAAAAAASLAPAAGSIGRWGSGASSHVGGQ